MSSSPLPRGYGSIRAVGETSVDARWRDGSGDRSKRFRGATMQEARDAAVDFLIRVHRDRRDGRYIAPTAMTVADVVEAYIDRCRDRLAGRTVRTYQDRFESMILPHIGNRSARELTTLDVQRWVDQLGRLTVMVNGKRVPEFKPSSIHAAISVLQGAYREAATLGIVPANVVQGVRRPTIKRGGITTWSQEQVRAVLQVVGANELFGALYTVALATGMRPGELRALQWKNVDLERGVIHVRTTISRDDDKSEQIVDRTKRGKGRAVAIGEAVVRKLRWHKARQAERRLMASTWDDHGLVFDRGDGHWMYQSHWLRRHHDFCEQAGVPVINHHALRHTAATLMLENGVHVKVVSEILGHANIQTTLDIYSHVSEALQRSAMDAMSGALFGVEDDNIDAKDSASEG